MKTIAKFGASAPDILVEARSELSGNAWKYAAGLMCWGLRDLTGTAKKFSGTYAQARDTASAVIKKHAKRKRYVFERSYGEGGWRMELRPSTMLNRARKMIEPFVTDLPPADPVALLMYPFHLRSPTAKQVRMALKHGPNVVRAYVTDDCVTMLISTTHLKDFDHRKRKAPAQSGVRLIDVLPR